MKFTSSPRVRRTRLAVALACACAAAATAQVVVVPPTPQIGSSNPVTAVPRVTRPHTKPCVVQLFQNQAFADFNLKSFSYTPPADCPAPWAKVVFTADFTVTAGRQFDRTAAFYLGHANIYYGTTAEPRAALSPSWHVEHDVTDLSAIFKSPQTGEGNLGNIVNSTYTGIIYASAALEFYPAGDDGRAPLAPDIVVPVNGPGGDAGTLNTTADQITQTLNLPTNVERVYLDVIAQSQIGDEFWYLCVPNDDATNLITCGGTSFRETEVSIDGQPAGVAPVSPWIYTGGIDPYLWEPIPGAQTLDFRPYRVDLTPFAGVLSDGNAHTVAVSVYGANSYFLATANLLVYQDHGATKVTGGILSNTLTAPSPTVTDGITPVGPDLTGTITVGSKRRFSISGYINTSHGRVETTVSQAVNFLSTQEFNVNPTTGIPEIQNAQQTSTLDSHTTIRGGPNAGTIDQHFSYPLTIDYTFNQHANGNYYQTVTADQQFLVRQVNNTGDGPAVVTNETNHVHAMDTYNWDPNFNALPPTGGHTTQTYRLQTSPGSCWDRTIVAVTQKLTSVQGGPGCHD